MSGDTGAPARPSRGQRALEWWRSHCDPTDARSDAGARARLRRARAPIEAMQVTAAIALARRLGAASGSADANGRRLTAALNLARVLAHVRAHEERHPMAAAGWPRFPGDRRESDAGSERPLLSEARFRRLLESDEGEAQVVAFTRLIALLGGTINVRQLADDFLAWSHPQYGDRVRERWAFHYFAAASAAPEPITTAPEDEDV